MHAENLAVLRIGNYLHKAIMRINDRCLGVAHKGELANFHLMALLLGLRLGQADAGDLRVRVGTARDARAIDRAGILAGQSCCHHQPRHATHVRQLWHTADDIADGIDAGLSRLHPFVGHDEATLRRDLRLVETDVGGARCAPNRNQYFLRLLRLRLAIRVRVGDECAFFILLDLSVLHGKVHLDAALLV